MKIFTNIKQLKKSSEMYKNHTSQRSEKQNYIKIKATKVISAKNVCARINNH